MIPPSSEEQNPVMRVATVQDKVAEAGVLDKESNIYASLGEDQGNLVSVHSSSFENQIPVSASGKQNGEAQCLASTSATQVSQQNLVDSAVNGISYQQIPLESSPMVQPLIALVLSSFTESTSGLALFNVVKLYVFHCFDHFSLEIKMTLNV